MRHDTLIRVATAIALIAGCAAPAAAQRGGGGGGDLSLGVPASRRNRLDILEAAFKLDGKQKDGVERVLNEAHKTATAVRDQLASTRNAISAAVMAGKDQTEIDKAVEAYAAQATAMASIEMKALAQILRILQPEQQGNGNAVRTAFFLIRGAFLDSRRWNTIPESRGY